MNEESLDGKSHLGLAEHRDNVVRKRRKVLYQDEEVSECGGKLVDEGEREEEEEFLQEGMQQLGAELCGRCEKVEDVEQNEVEEFGEKEKDVEEVEEFGHEEEVVEEEEQQHEEDEQVVEQEQDEEEPVEQVQDEEEPAEQDDDGGDDDDDDDDDDEDDDDDDEEEEEEEEHQEINWREKIDYIKSSSSNKEIKEMSTDQFSALPDSLLIHILSFLNMGDAVRTSVLSKRWRFLWTDSPNLSFDCCTDEISKMPKFVAWVHRTLVICRGNHLQKFEVSFTYEKQFASDVNAWVKFVLKNNVKTVGLFLNIDYFGYRRTSPQYKLPKLMYSSSSFTQLCLQGCKIAPRRTIKWTSLTKLYLEEIELDEDIIENLLLGCPVLYDLTLSECWSAYGFDHMEINSRSLHVLTIESWNDEDFDFLKVSAPYIHSLTIRPKLYGMKLILSNISPLVRVKVDFWEQGDCTDKLIDVMSHINELLGSLQHVKDLEVEHGFIEVLSMLAVTGWQLPQSERECLTVHTCSDEYSIPGIICLLESSPNLKEFTINSDHIMSRSHEGCFPNGLATSYFKKADLNCDLLHLKTVNMRRFAHISLDGEPMLTMAQLLLKRATVLEKMVIGFELYNRYWLRLPSTSNYVEITEALLSYERSSPNAVVLPVSL